MAAMMTTMIVPSTFRTRSERRYNNIRKSLRKRRIVKEVYPKEPNWNYYDNLHQYSKNKIHCSCYLCSCKTRDKKKKDSPPVKQRRRIDEMDYELKEMNTLGEVL